MGHAKVHIYYQKIFWRDSKLALYDWWLKIPPLRHLLNVDATYKKTGITDQTQRLRSGHPVAIKSSLKSPLLNGSPFFGF